jgi:hypothetical protein
METQNNFLLIELSSIIDRLLHMVRPELQQKTLTKANLFNYYVTYEFEQLQRKIGAFAT